MCYFVQPNFSYTRLKSEAGPGEGQMTPFWTIIIWEAKMISGKKAYYNNTISHDLMFKLLFQYLII